MNWSVDLLAKVFEFEINIFLLKTSCDGVMDILTRSVLCWSLTPTTFGACWVLWIAISLRLWKRRPKGECQQVACLYFKIRVQNSWTQRPSKKKKRKKKRPSNILLWIPVQWRSIQYPYSGIRYNTCFVVGIKWNMYYACYTSTYNTYITVVRTKIKRKQRFRFI